MFMSRAMRSVFEIGVGDLVFRLETKNLVILFFFFFPEFRKDFGKIFPGVCLSVSWSP